MNNQITKSKKRVKELGEVFTPPALVDEMLDRLPPETWHPEKTFIDPTCGTGNFLVSVVQRKVKAGATPLQALRTTFGIDIMDDNVRECRERLLEALGNPDGGEEVVRRNIIVADSLAIDWETVFEKPPSMEDHAGPAEAIDDPAPTAEANTQKAGPCRRRSVADPEIRSARRAAPRSGMVP